MDIRKLFALLVVLVLIGSVVPAAFADSGSGESGSSNDDNESADNNSGNDDGQIVTVDASADVQADDNNGRIEFEQRTRMRDGQLDLGERMRERSGKGKERREEMRLKVQERLDEFRAEKEHFQERKGDLLKQRDALSKECKGGQGSNTCKMAKEKFVGSAKEFMISAAGKLIDHLDKLQNFVEEKGDGGNTSAQLLVKIEDIRVDVEGTIVDIEALPENATREDLGTARDELNDEWNRTRELTKEIGKIVVKHKVDKASQRLVNLEEKLNEMRDKLDAAGANTTQLDALLASFSAELEASQNTTDASAAREHFTNAVHSLRDIMHEIRDLREGVRNETEVNVNGGRGRDDKESDNESDDDGNNATETAENETEDNETEDDDVTNTTGSN